MYMLYLEIYIYIVFVRMWTPEQRSPQRSTGLVDFRRGMSEAQPVSLAFYTYGSSDFIIIRNNQHLTKTTLQKPKKPKNLQE